MFFAKQQGWGQTVHWVLQPILIHAISKHFFPHWRLSGHISNNYQCFVFMPRDKGYLGLSGGEYLFSQSSQLWKEKGFYFEFEYKSCLTNKHLKSVDVGFARGLPAYLLLTYAPSTSGCIVMGKYNERLAASKHFPLPSTPPCPAP